MNIILVDDEEIIHKTLGSFLARSGHTVRTALNGMEALRLLGDAIPDLIISDVGMPVMGGLELVEKFKVRAPATPIILITGHGDEDTAVAALHKGVHDYLRKPIKLEELFGLLERIEERKQLEHSLMQESARPNHSRRLITVGSLAVGIAREIDKPTTMINGNLQIFQRILERFEPLLRRVCGEDPERKQLMQLVDEFSGLTGAMQKESEQIVQIVQQLQMFAHTQSRVPEAVDLSACLDQALAQTEEERRGILLEKQIRQEFVEGVSQELTQLFVSAMQNAAQAIGERPGGRIGVEVTSHEADHMSEHRQRTRGTDRFQLAFRPGVPALDPSAARAGEWERGAAVQPGSPMQLSARRAVGREGEPHPDHDEAEIEEGGSPRSGAGDRESRQGLRAHPGQRLAEGES